MRPVPSDIAAERATLGALLMERDAVIAVAGWLQPAHFYLEKHAHIYEAVLACAARREPPDLATVSSELRRLGRLEQAGGLAALGELVAEVPTAVHVEHYARLVEVAAGRRQLIECGGRVAALGYDEARTLAETYDEAEQALFAVTQRAGTGALAAAGRVASEVWEHLGTSDAPALTSGLADLDRRIIGWRPGRLYVVAARPGGGKTGFGMTALAAACQRGNRVLLFSLEMDRVEVGFRLASGITGIASQAIEARTLGEAQMAAVGQALGKIEPWDFLVSDLPGEHISAIRGKARRAHAEQPIDLIIVDYLQLAEADGERRDLVVSAVVRGLKNLARELRVPVLALAQLSRAVEARAGKVPQLSDLRESGEIEQAADCVLFLHHPSRDDESATPGVAEIHIAKQRNGPLGVVAVQFDGPTTHFRDLSRYRSPEGF